jgi:molecular chaperone HscB
MSDIHNHKHTCWNCYGDAPETDYCPSCHRILPLVENIDYFSYLGLKKQLNLDIDDLEKRFYEMSRKYHPDYHTNGDEIEKEISEERTSFLNSAYRILRDPIQRAKYLLQLEWGEIPKEDKKVPPELLMEIMELQEKLQEEKTEEDIGRKKELKKVLNRISDDLKNKLDSMNVELNSLFRKWDDLNEHTAPIELRHSILKEISKNLSIRAYLGTLISTYEN